MSESLKVRVKRPRMLSLSGSSGSDSEVLDIDYPDSEPEPAPLKRQKPVEELKLHPDEVLHNDPSPESATEHVSDSGSDSDSERESPLPLDWKLGHGTCHICAKDTGRALRSVRSGALFSVHFLLSVPIELGDDFGIEDEHERDWHPDMILAGPCGLENHACCFECLLKIFCTPGSLHQQLTRPGANSTLHCPFFARDLVPCPFSYPDSVLTHLFGQCFARISQLRATMFRFRMANPIHDAEIQSDPWNHHVWNTSPSTNVAFPALPLQNALDYQRVLSQFKSILRATEHLDVPCRECCVPIRHKHQCFVLSHCGTQMCFVCGYAGLRIPPVHFYSGSGSRGITRSCVRFPGTLKCELDYQCENCDDECRLESHQNGRRRFFEYRKKRHLAELWTCLPPRIIDGLQRDLSSSDKQTILDALL